MKKRTIVAAMFLAAVSSTSLKRQMRKPEKISEGKTRWLTDRVIAHRGIHDNDGDVPENTLAAFQEAADRGYAIELDVRLTKDGQVVVIHDKKLKRLLSMDGQVQDLSYEDFRQGTILDSIHRIPLFSQVLELVDGKVPLLIEIKSHGQVGPLEEKLYELIKSYKGLVAIQSFNPLSVKWFRDHAPEVVRGQLSGNFVLNAYEKEVQGETELPTYQKILLKHMMLNFLSKPNFIAYEIEGTDHIRIIHLGKLGVPLLGWTVRTRVDYLEVKDLFDNLICDDVTVVF
jgi:glycerophosphoryl diester phosphodiesterase